ncbi:hypothetical protein A3Q56_03139 [Intoshia linei]|uniref:ATP-grasp domain-containing protein n=1 Tax=Intoshia linei TaxID=1819745 RepID=A0A177B6Q5_9BILA|nr:hypothetical protein A3Q56_03139 [Intoshia linei]
MTSTTNLSGIKEIYQNSVIIPRKIGKLKRNSKSLINIEDGIKSKEKIIIRNSTILCNEKPISLEKIQIAKKLSEQVIKERRLFTLIGSYPMIREALKNRGWIEVMRKPSYQRPYEIRIKRKKQIKNEFDSINDLPESPTKKNSHILAQDENLYDLVSRMTKHCIPYFIWTVKRESFDIRNMQKDQYINHYSKSSAFTTKVGLCVNLRELVWFNEHQNSFHPRCYRLNHEGEKISFIEDWRLTACVSILKIARDQALKEKANENFEKENVKNSKILYISSRYILMAMRQCRRYLRSIRNEDIDDEFDNHKLSDKQWSIFINNYYNVIHNKFLIENASLYYDEINSVVREYGRQHQQMFIDGYQNVWILKPGAKSRGRGIICYDRLDDILKLVDNNLLCRKESKYIIQKYIERPLLIYGTKFDIRQWFLITDWNPLTIWIYKYSYLRFSSSQFTLNNFEEAIHLTNNAIQSRYKNNANRHPNLPENNMWYRQQFQKYLQDWNLLPKSDLHFSVEYYTDRLINFILKNEFELYGADFMLSEDYKIWLIEINSSPSMSYSTSVTAKLCPIVLEDVIKVVLDRRQDKNCSTGGFELAYKQVPVAVPQYSGTNLILQGEAIPIPTDCIKNRMRARLNIQNLNDCKNAFQDDNRERERFTNFIDKNKNNCSVKFNKTPRPSKSVQIHSLKEKTKLEKLENYTSKFVSKSIKQEEIISKLTKIQKDLTVITPKSGDVESIKQKFENNSPKFKIKQLNEKLEHMNESIKNNDNFVFSFNKKEHTTLNNINVTKSTDLSSYLINHMFLCVILSLSVNKSKYLIATDLFPFNQTNILHLAMLLDSKSGTIVDDDKINKKEKIIKIKQVKMNADQNFINKPQSTYKAILNAIAKFGKNSKQSIKKKKLDNSQNVDLNEVYSTTEKLKYKIVKNNEKLPNWRNHDSKIDRVESNSANGTPISTNNPYLPKNTKQIYSYLLPQSNDIKLSKNESPEKLLYKSKTSIMQLNNEPKDLSYSNVNSPKYANKYPIRQNHLKISFNRKIKNNENKNNKFDKFATRNGKMKQLFKNGQLTNNALTNFAFTPKHKNSQLINEKFQNIDKSFKDDNNKWLHRSETNLNIFTSYNYNFSKNLKPLNKSLESNNELKIDHAKWLDSKYSLNDETLDKPKGKDDQKKSKKNKSISLIKAFTSSMCESNRNFILKKRQPFVYKLS